MSEIKVEELQELVKLADAATPGPWIIDPDDRPDMEWNNHIVSGADPNQAICFMTHSGTDDNSECEANAELIVIARNLAKQLAQAEIDRRITPVEKMALLEDLQALIDSAVLSPMASEIVEQAIAALSAPVQRCPECEGTKVVATSTRYEQCLCQGRVMNCLMCHGSGSYAVTSIDCCPVCKQLPPPPAEGEKI